MVKYWKVIQQNYGQGWEDVSSYEAKRDGTPIEMSGKTRTLRNGYKIEVSLLSHDLAEYKRLGYPTRVVVRKEK